MTKAEAIQKIKEVRAFFLSRAKSPSEKYDIQIFFDDVLNELEKK